MSKVAFIYEIGPEASQTIDRGEIEARDEADARRRLRGMLGTAQLPPNTRLLTKAAVAAREARSRSARLRYLLHVLREHHAWLSGQPAGKRADLSRLDLSGVSLRKRDLSNANLSEADFSSSDLSGAVLAGANLTGANLQGANLRNADLRRADLSEADLRGAVLIGSKLDGAECWRANFKGCTIAAKMLHAAFECRSK